MTDFGFDGVLDFGLVEWALFTADELKQRATEALDCYVGDTQWLLFNLDEICQTLR